VRSWARGSPRPRRLGSACVAQSPACSIGYNWSYLACRIGHLVPIWQPLGLSAPGRATCAAGAGWLFVGAKGSHACFWGAVRTSRLGRALGRRAVPLGPRARWALCQMGPLRRLLVRLRASCAPGAVCPSWLCARCQGRQCVGLPADLAVVLGAHGPHVGGRPGGHGDASTGLATGVTIRAVVQGVEAGAGEKIMVAQMRAHV
jgi:hypothetical protein